MTDPSPAVIAANASPTSEFKELADKLRKLSYEELQSVILRIKPRGETQAGINFMLYLLKNESVEGVAKFIEQGGEILDDEGKYERSDFTVEHEKQLEKTRIATSRRNFLRTLGWSIPGAVYVAEGFLHFTNKTLERLDKEEQASSTANPQQPVPLHSRRDMLGCFRHGMHVVNDYWDWLAVPPATVLIGVTLINEHIEKKDEIRLNEIANAVAAAIATLRTGKQSPRRSL